MDLRIALAGNPNSGKTTLFNALTGSNQFVGNWPGVTVEKKEGKLKKRSGVTITDLPGIYSLSPYTLEEVVARNYLIKERPDAILNIIDGTNLERNLYLTTQLMEIDVPIVVALNMMDAVRKNGDSVDGATLEKKIGLPVVEISALRGEGISRLMEKTYAASKSKRSGVTVLEDCALGHLIGDVKIALEGQKVENPLFHAVKLAEEDELETKAHPDAVKTVRAFKDTFRDNVFGDDFEALVADSRYKYITKHFSSAFRKGEKAMKGGLNRSDRADKVLTHKIWGIPIFLVILFAIFHLTFSENFLYLGGLFPEGWVSLEGTAFEGVFGKGGINSPGVILANLLGLGTDSLTALAEGWLSGSPDWVAGLVCDGILGGLFSILSFLPQILLLFLFFSILEDSGYMARVAFILDRIFRRFGLSGRAFMPMIMGFGCSIPAMINTRTLADENERTATVRVIPFFSCGAKLPILTAVAGAIVASAGIGNADLITYSMYLLGVVVAIISVLLMRNTTMRGEVPPFIMELPSYHAPQFKNLMLHLWDKTKHFVKKAFTIILASTIVIWFISHFSFSWQFLPDEQINQSILAGLGQLVQPLFTPLGFGSQLGSWGWVFVVAAITGLIAKENVISTFSVLAACIVAGFEGTEEGVEEVLVMMQATGITVPALLSFIAFNMTTIPCFAAVATAKAELPDKKRFNYTLLFWLVTSYIVSAAVYLIGSWWWTSFIFAAAIAVTVVGIVLFNQGRFKRRRA